MNSPPASDREYAYFSAIGVDDVAEITRILTVEPCQSWNVGEPFEINGHPMTRRSSNWQLSSGMADTDHLSSHLEALLFRLERHRNALLEVQKKFQTRFVCVGYYYQSFSWEMSFEIQRRATALGIGFWFDTYSLGDHHEQMVSLREELGVRENRQ